MVNPQLPLSIVIISKNEEKVIAALLHSIRDQTVSVKKIILADAQSQDSTRSIARQFGCEIVEGGIPAVGRNAGAAVADTEYLLFLDADMVFPTKTTLYKLFFAFTEANADISSVRFRATRGASSSLGVAIGNIVYSGWNFMRRVQHSTKKMFSQGGGCILLRRSVFTKLGGFSPKLVVSEDTDFFKRAVMAGYKYVHLHKIIVNTSPRRFADPRKLPSYFKSTLAVGALVLLGLYTRKKLLKKFSKGYGKLGGDQDK